MLWQGDQVIGLSPDAVCRLGIVQVPEGRKLFPKMTVLENLEMGAYLPAARTKLSESLTRVFDLFPRLAERTKQAAEVPFRRRTANAGCGPCVDGSPRLLMLDEPSLGLAPIVAKRDLPHCR